MRDAMADQHDDAQPEEKPMRDDVVMGAGGQQSDPYEPTRIGTPMRDADAGGQQEPDAARPWIDSMEQREGGDAR